MYEWIIWWLENFNSSPPKLTIIYAPQSSHLVMHDSTVLTTYVSRHVVTVIILCKLQHCLNSWSVRQGQCRNNLSKTTQIACSRMTTTMFSHRGRAAAVATESVDMMRARKVWVWLEECDSMILFVHIAFGRDDGIIAVILPTSPSLWPLGASHACRQTKPASLSSL